MFDAPGTVVQGLRLDRQLAGGDDAPVGAIVQQAVDIQMQRAVTGGLHLAADIAQCAGRQVQRTGGRQGTGAVVEAAGYLYLAGLLAGRLQGSRAVVQCSGAQIQCAVTGQGATGVVQQAADSQFQRLGTRGDQAATGGAETVRFHLDALGTGAALAQVELAAAERQRAVADQRASNPVQGARLDRQLAITGMLDAALCV